MNSKTNTQILAIVLLVVGLGLGLAIWGYQEAGSFGSQFSSRLSGSPSDKVMTLYLTAAASAAVGLFLLAKK